MTNNGSIDDHIAASAAVTGLALVNAPSPKYSICRNSASIHKGEELGYLLLRGYEVSTTTTPFDMTVIKDLDRFHLTMDVIARVPHSAETNTDIDAHAYCEARLAEHHSYIRGHGDDMSDVREWHWAS